MCKASGNDEEGQQVNHKKRSGTDYKDLAPIPFFETAELKLWRFYKAVIAEFVASFLFLYVSVATIIGHNKGTDQCNGVGVLRIAMAVGGMIFILVYCTAGMSGGHINPAVTLAMLVSRRVSLLKAVAYLVAQCLGGICGVGLVKALMKHSYVTRGGGANSVAPDFSKGAALGAEIVGTFVLVYTVLTASDPKRRARDKPVAVLLPLPIGFAVFVVHLATIPITGTGINPARSFAAAVVHNNRKVWDDQWIFWVGPYLGALIATVYNDHVLRASNGIKQKTTVPL